MLLLQLCSIKYTFKGDCGQNDNIFFSVEEKKRHKFMPKSYILYLMIPKIGVLSEAELSWNLACPSSRLVTR